MTTDRITFMTLGEFERRYGIHKGTVSKRAREMGFDTSAGLTHASYEAMKQEFGIRETPAIAPTAPTTGGMTIHSGNHCQTVDLPGFEGMSVDLGQFRDSESLVVDDPLAVAEQFTAAADMILKGLENDIAARQQRLQTTKQAQQRIATKADELRLEQRLYKLQTSQIDHAQTEETTALAEALAQLQSLGKPVTEAGADTAD